MESNEYKIYNPRIDKIIFIYDFMLEIIQKKFSFFPLSILIIFLPKREFYFYKHLVYEYLCHLLFHFNFVFHHVECSSFESKFIFTFLLYKL